KKATRIPDDRRQQTNDSIVAEEQVLPRRDPIVPDRPLSGTEFPYSAHQFEVQPRGIPTFKNFEHEVVKYSIKKTASDIRTLLLEWIQGLEDNRSHQQQLSIQELNRDFGTLWRVRGERNLYNSRSTIVREFKRLVQERGMTEDEAIQSLQERLGRNAFLTLSKAIGRENVALGRYQNDDSGEFTRPTRSRVITAARASTGIKSTSRVRTRSSYSGTNDKDIKNEIESSDEDIKNEIESSNEKLKE
ncbi:hypothetical protein BG004_006693, partial [Podila humilis]